MLVALAACALEIDATLVLARAEAGVAEDQHLLGLMYATGSGVPQDDAEAARCSDFTT